MINIFNYLVIFLFGLNLLSNQVEKSVELKISPEKIILTSDSQKLNIRTTLINKFEHPAVIYGFDSKLESVIRIKTDCKYEVTGIHTAIMDSNGFIFKINYNYPIPKMPDSLLGKEILDYEILDNGKYRILENQRYDTLINNRFPSLTLDSSKSLVKVWYRNSILDSRIILKPGEKFKKQVVIDLKYSTLRKGQYKIKQYFVINKNVSQIIDNDKRNSDKDYIYWGCIESNEIDLVFK